MALRPIRLNAPVAGSTASTTDDDGNVRTIDVQVVKIIQDDGTVVDDFGGVADVLELTPVLDTNAYAGGDLLFDATELANFVRAVGKTALIQSVTVTDADDQGIAFDLFCAYETVDFGTVNSAPSISDADAAKVQRVCRVESSDYIDLGGVRSATITNIGLVVEPAAASRSMFFAGVTRGAPTYTASGLTIRFGVLWLS